MALQQKAIQKLMKTLQCTHNSNATELLNTAILSCHSRYHTIQEVIDECLYQRSISSSYTEFLKNRCGIDLANVDTGALLGFDACGDIAKSAISIIPETAISDWKMPDSTEVYYGALKVIYPALNSLTSDQEFIVGCLHTWWIERALHLIASSYGYEFNDIKVEPKEITVKFENGASGVLAYVSVLSNLITGKVTELELVINNNLYVNMDKTNPNGVSLTNPNLYLDRTIAHEFVHAVQATNIDFFDNLSHNYLWFTEGSAELVHGIDDYRLSNIIAVVTDETRFKQAFTGSPVTDEDVYSAGYILLRYFARQVANGYTQKYRIKRHLMAEKGKVYSLKELGEKFIEFAQRSNNGVQAWKLATHGDNSFKELSSFYGETLKIPMKNHADVNAEDKYYLFTSQIMEKPSGSVDINFIDVLKAQYQRINVIEDYTATGLNNVLSFINGLGLTEPAHIVFSGCELDLNNGLSVTDVLNNIKNVVSVINSSGSRASLLLTPTPDMYVGDTVRDDYKQLLRTSYISRKLSMVCIGDSITDPSGADSWTDYCQEILPKLNIINKGVGGNRSYDALARFDADVLKQLPDICLFLIGGNDMWEANAPEMAAAKANLQTMVDSCISNNIVPIIVSYVPTLEQIEMTRTNGWTTKPAIEVLDNFIEYRLFCKELATNKDILFIDNMYLVLRHIEDGSIDKDNVVPDLIHLTTAGKKKVGAYIASKIKDLVFTMQNNLSQDYDIINLYDVFCKSLGTEELTLTQLNTLIDSGRYKEGKPYDYITEYIFGEGLLRPFNCPYFYVSLEHMNVDENTYYKFYSTYYKPGIEYLSPQGQHPLGTIAYQTEDYGSNSVVDSPSWSYYNLFRNTGEFVAFGVHTLYDENLWMCEQGGITCEEEATKEKADMNWMTHEIYYSGNSPILPPVKRFAVFPGTGCPWLTLSDDNKIEFGVSENGIEYWFTKSDYDATITFRVSNNDMDSYYQSISLGMLTNVNEDSYLFPLYAAGGTQALMADIQHYSIPNDNNIHYITGNMYDLNIKCISMANSNLLTPTKFNKADTSNFKVLAPSGEWKKIYVNNQDCIIRAHPVCSPGRVPRYYVTLGEPVWVGSDSHSISVALENNRKKIDTYTVSRGLSRFEHSSVLDQIIVNLNGNIEYGENGCMGIIPNCFSSWYRTLVAGEIDIDGKHYLSVPNGWEGRLWKYPYNIGFYPVSKDDWDSETIQQNYADLFNCMTDKVMVHRLLIPLEEEGE